LLPGTAGRRSPAASAVFRNGHGCYNQAGFPERWAGPAVFWLTEVDVTWEQLIARALKQSPFLAFRREDVEKVEARHRSKRRVYVRFAYQWKDWKGNPRSGIYKALKKRAQKAFDEVVAKLPESSHRLDFAKLRGEAGTYLLRKIIVDTMCADILMLDLTYRNPNVLFELGLAYAMGRRFFLIVREDRKGDVPSDLDGLTISPYRGAMQFCNSSTMRDIRSTFREVIRRKIASSR
jgi:hypothetical protein